MKTMRKRVGLLLMSLALALFAGGVWGGAMAEAKSDDNIILDGIYMGEIDLSGMTADEAKAAVNAFVEQLKLKNITFGVVDGHYVAITVADLGVSWVNQNDIDAAVSLGKTGNIVKRYKVLEDLKHEKKVYDLQLAFDPAVLRAFLEEQCTEYDVAAVNASLTLTDGVFAVTEGQSGQRVNIDASLNRTIEFLTNEWNYQDASIDLVIDVEAPKGDAEELAQVKDVLGTFTTSYSSSGSARSANVENGCRLINGTLLYPGEEFSTYNAIKPFTKENGYYPAGSYLNGKVVDSIGGGICQVSTTLYNAVLLSELEVVERNNHSMIVSYVEPSMDAAISESAGKDFRFVNNYEHPIYIEGHTEGKKITFTIYGVETRDPGHKVTYKSEVLSTTNPDHEEIIADGGQGIGYINVQSAHIGHKAQLWRIVEENGVEVSREVINSSSYQPSPRTATVGVNTSNPEYASRIQAAIASGSIDNCKAEAAAIKAEMAAASQQQAEQEAYDQALLQQQQQALEQQAAQ